MVQAWKDDVNLKLKHPIFQLCPNLGLSHQLSTDMLSSLIPYLHIFQNVTAHECIIFQQLTMLRKGPMDGLPH